MNKADGEDTANRLSTVVANSLDVQAKTEDLARQAYQSRTQFHRLFRTVVEETPAAMRRRLLLERAAYQLAHTGDSVTDIALNANYGSLEAFTRAFRKAFRRPSPRIKCIAGGSSYKTRCPAQSARLLGVSCRRRAPICPSRARCSRLT